MRHLTTCLLLVLLCGATWVSCSRQASDRFEQDWLEQVEDLAEALANDLLALSVAVRDRDLDAIGGYLADEVNLDGFPTGTEGVQPVARWVVKHGWQRGGQRQASRSALLLDMEAFLGHFSVIEDVRFKVKGAEFDVDSPDHGRARIKFFIIGRDDERRREWLTAWMNSDVVRGEAGWQLATMEFESVNSQVAEQEVFSEVGLPAGVAAIFPPFGVGANAGFISHGAAVGDVDGDGLLDLVATGVEQNYMYLNRGNGTFVDRSAETLVSFAPIGSGPLLLDYDNDGDSDLFLAAVGSQVLLQNRLVPDGKVEFWDVTDESGVGQSAVGFSAAAADVDGNGHTDIYVASYNRYGTVMPDAWGRATNGTPNLLLLNLGDGTFVESAEKFGLADSRWSYAASFVDLDGDGDQDLYVANDFGENALYRNDGDRFTDIAAQAGVVDPGFGMGVSFGDYDNDGDLDLHVTNMSSTAGNRILKRLYPEESTTRATLGKLASGNSLYENRGDGTFRDVSAEAGPFGAGWAFGGGFFDLDNDGLEDLYTPNGFISGDSMKDT